MDSVDLLPGDMLLRRGEACDEMLLSVAPISAVADTIEVGSPPPGRPVAPSRSSRSQNSLNQGKAKIAGHLSHLRDKPQATKTPQERGSLCFFVCLRAGEGTGDQNCWPGEHGWNPEFEESKLQDSERGERDDLPPRYFKN